MGVIIPLTVLILAFLSNAEHAINFKIYQNADLNKDNKLSGRQFLEASINAVVAAVIFILGNRKR